MNRSTEESQTRFYKEVGARIQKLRKEQKMTQDVLASQLSLTRTSITNIEKGRQKILLHTFIDIAHVLRVPLLSLLPTMPGTQASELDLLLKDSPEDINLWIRATVALDRKEA